VVRDPALRADAVANVAAAAARLGWSMHGVTSSRLPGPSGNVEFFLWLRRASGPVNETGARAAIERAAAASAGLQDGLGEATARRT
jgi:23S rRNA (cytidine1920-2'-O)/16S rRNA (cytidine1409-2'-O)-methyltransferase